MFRDGFFQNLEADPDSATSSLRRSKSSAIRQSSTRRQSSARRQSSTRRQPKPQGQSQAAQVSAARPSAAPAAVRQTSRSSSAARDRVGVGIRAANSREPSSTRTSGGGGVTSRHSRSSSSAGTRNKPPPSSSSSVIGSQFATPPPAGGNKLSAVVNGTAAGSTEMERLDSEGSVSSDSLSSSLRTKKSFSGTNMQSSLGYLP